jgi:heme A synthase
LLAFQFCLGVLDVLLRAPVWMQVVHLAGADAFWCVLVVLTARVALREKERPHPAFSQDGAASSLL